MPRNKDIDITAVVRYDRETFIKEYWDYQAGEHVTVLAPTGGGKTQLAYSLLGATATRDMQAVVMVMKPRDETVDKFTAKYKFQVIRDWPPLKMKRVIAAKPPGYVLWPKESGNLYRDNELQHRVFERAINDSYLTKESRIIFADEVVSLQEELGLTPELKRVWTKGRSMKAGLWAASQRPRNISMYAYHAHHLFFGFEPDANAQKRYAEIGAGVDPDLIIAIVSKLPKYEFLYIHRDSRRLCIVGK